MVSYNIIVSQVNYSYYLILLVMVVVYMTIKVVSRVY